MALPTTGEEWVARLSALHDRELSELRELNDEYELRAARAYMHPEVEKELGSTLQQVVIAWPQLVVDSVEERLDVEGFRLPDEAEADDDLWAVWQANDMDEQSQQGRVDALVMKRSFICVGANEEDPDVPLVTCESPLEMYADIDPRTRKGRAALRRWVDAEAAPTSLNASSGAVSASSWAAGGTAYSTLYLPDRREYRVNGKLEDVDEHGLGDTMVVPVVNRGRLTEWLGRSELSPILPLSRAANKIATDMMVAADMAALPTYGFLGIGPEDLEDAQGNKLTALQARLRRFLTIPDDDGTGKHFSFPAADLTNFHATVNQLARLVASIAGLPPHYVGLTSENPPSADAIRSAEMRLVKRAERKQVPFEGAYEHTMRLVKRIQDGGWDPRYRRLETIWRDPSTPTVAQRADAAVKLFSTTPRALVPLRQTREDLGYTNAQIARMEAEDVKQAASDPLTLIAESLGRDRAPAAA